MWLKGLLPRMVIHAGARFYRRQTYTLERGIILGILKALRHWPAVQNYSWWRIWRRFMAFKRSQRIRQHLSSLEGLQVPPVIILSVTTKCNLHCLGCYSRNYPREDELSDLELELLLTEASSLGVGLFVLTGGEPLMRKGLLDILRRHKRLLFLLFTNGSFLTAEKATTIAQADNIVPIVSIEGLAIQTDFRRGEGMHEIVRIAMRRLQLAKAIFGFSLTAHRQNIHQLGLESFYDEMIARGCSLGFCFDFVAAATSGDNDLRPSSAVQLDFRRKIERFQKEKPLLMIHLPADEYEHGGVCLAAGRGFLHINAQGYVEPCPFFHHAVHSIRQKSLKEIMASEFLAELRRVIPRLPPAQSGCALLENREDLAKTLSAYGAMCTHSRR
jgi:MoaA/NifB/PqqE/SkfB family radical SAM enzyme